MHLPDRRAAERLGLKRREQLADLRAQLGADHTLDIGVRKRRGAVEQMEQLEAVVLRQQVEAQREQLAELRPGASEGLERAPQPHGPRRAAPAARDEQRRDAADEQHLEHLEQPPRRRRAGRRCRATGASDVGGRMRRRRLCDRRCGRDLTLDDGSAVGEDARMAAQLGPYLCDLHRSWLAADPDRRWREEDGSLLFFDISGFTPLTERLAKRGKAGVEQLLDILDGVIAPLVETAGDLGGDTVKFGGDALLIAFEGPGHARRACAAAWDMQRALAPYRRRETSAGIVSLRASAGVASGSVQAFLVGDRFTRARAGRSGHERRHGARARGACRRGAHLRGDRRSDRRRGDRPARAPAVSR